MDGIAPATTFLVYADDGMLIADSPNTLQLAFDTLWMIASAMGLNAVIKKKSKTAWTGVYYHKGQPKDIANWTIKFPDGTPIPQLQNGEEYKYLGTHLPAAWNTKHTHATTRQKTIQACKKVIQHIGSLPLAPETLNRAINLATAGIIGCFGRSTPITYEDCKTIEAEKSAVLNAQQIAPPVPKGPIYDTHHNGGLQFEHTYACAAAALADQIDRALSAPPDSTDYRTVAAAITETYARLGYRGNRPLEWHPLHLDGKLREDNLIEAWLQIQLRTGRRPRQTAARLHQALEEDSWQFEGTLLWEPSTVEANDGLLYRMPAMDFQRDLAALGIALWEDVTDPEGNIIRIGQLKNKFGVKNDCGTDERVRQLLHNLQVEVKKFHNTPMWTAWLEQRQRNHQNKIHKKDEEPEHPLQRPTT